MKGKNITILVLEQSVDLSEGMCLHFIKCYIPNESEKHLLTL